MPYLSTKLDSQNPPKLTVKKSRKIKEKLSDLSER
jgi:hypothetical protein